MRGSKAKRLRSRSEDLAKKRGWSAETKYVDRYSGVSRKIPGGHDPESGEVIYHQIPSMIRKTSECARKLYKQLKREV